MQKISIIYRKQTKEISDSLIQSIKYNCHKSIFFEIFTSKENILKSCKLMKDWDLSFHCNTTIHNTNALINKTIDINSIICLSVEDFSFLHDHFKFDIYGTFYKEPIKNLELLLYDDYLKVYEIVDLFLQQQRKGFSYYDNIFFITKDENINEEESITLAGLEKFGTKITKTSMLKFLNTKEIKNTLVISTSAICFLPILNLVYHEWLLTYKFTSLGMVGYINTNCFTSAPKALIKNLRLIYDDILFKENPDEEIYNNNTEYSVFANYYEQYTLSNKKYFLNWHKFILERYEEINNKKPSNMLDIACGTAVMSKKIKKECPEINIDACDLNPEMLDNAKDSSNIRLFQADMRRLGLNKKYDLVICTFDSVNYLRNIRDFYDMLMGVWRCLEINGVFIFDVSMIKNSKDNFNEITNYQNIGPDSILQCSFYIPQESKQITVMQSYVKSFNIYSSFNEIHIQKIWKCKEIIDLIKETQFEISGIYDAITLKKVKYSKKANLDNSYFRLFFVLKKNEYL